VRKRGIAAVDDFFARRIRPQTAEDRSAAEVLGLKPAPAAAAGATP
jgi:hypothetical protein